MKMATITIPVPDGDTCKGCEYKGHSCVETSYQCYDEYDTCEIFKCKLKDNKKCISCRMLAKMDGDGDAID